MQPLTWNAHREILPNGLARAEFHGKWVNYVNSENKWEAIDVTPQSVGQTFVFDRGPYTFIAPKKSKGEFRFESTNRYDIWEPGDNKIKGEPPLGITKTFPTAVNVDGVAMEDGSIEYVGALPDLNADIVIVPHEQHVKYLVRFNEAPPGILDVTVPFDVETDGVRAKKSMGRGKGLKEIIKTGYEDFDEGFSFTNGSLFRGVSFKKAQVWDSSVPIMKSQYINIIGGQDGNVFHAKKVIPRAFFTGVTYPVYTDATSTFYPDPHTEVTSVDGRTNNELNGTYATAHDAASSTGAGDTNTYVDIWNSHDAASNYNVVRSMILFDTSALGATATITAATLTLTGYSAGFVTEAGGADSLAIVTTTPASNTAITTADFDQYGTTLQATALAFSSIDDDGANAITLNATGLTNISKTGVTKFGIRTLDDVNNTDASGNGDVYAFFKSADHASGDPQLDVTYTVAGNTRSPGGGAAYGGVFFY